MKLWKFECRKVWKNQIVLYILFGCLVLNAGFLYYQTTSYDLERGCFPSEIKEVYQELEEIPDKEKIAWLDQEQEMMLSGEIPGNRKRVIDNIKIHAENVYGYEEYLTRIEEQANLMQSSFLFSKEDSFSRKNAEKIPEVYEHLHGIQLKLENPQGVLLAVRTPVTDIISVFLVVLFACFFITLEREEGTMAFVRCTRYGTKKLGKTKIFLIFLSSMLGALALYGCNLLIAWLVYGFGDTSRWIQSLDGYETSPWKLTVGQYLLAYPAAKLAALAVIAGVVTWVVLRGRSILKSGVVLFVIAAVEYGLYTKITPQSWLDLLRKCNLFAFFHTEGFFDNYETVNFFGIPVSAVWMSIGAGGALLLLTVAGSIHCYEKVSKSEYTEKAGRKFFKSKRKKHRKMHSIAFYECRKLLWIQGAVVVLATCLILQCFVYYGKRTSFSMDELYYKNYIEKLEGPVTDEKRNYLEEEGARIQSIEEEYLHFLQSQTDMSLLERGKEQRKLENRLECKNGYEQVRDQAERIGENGVFLNEVGFAYLLNREEEMKNCGKLLVAVMFAFFSVFVVERTSGMETLWTSIPGGRRKVMIRKWILITVCIVFTCILSDAISVFSNMSAQGISHLHLPVQYVPGFENLGQMTVDVYLGLRCLAKIVAGLLTVVWIGVVSRKAKNATTVLIVSGSAVAVVYLVVYLIVGK